MEKRKEDVIKLIIELAKFFIACDGHTDEKEIEFVEMYILELIEKGEATKKDIEAIQTGIDSELTIEYLIQQTKNLSNNVTKEDRVALLHGLSYFIYQVIVANDIIHPNESRFYTEWKEHVGIDDNVDIDIYLK